MIRNPSDGTTRRAENLTGAQELVPARTEYIALKARHGDNWGINPPPEPPKRQSQTMTAEQLKSHYAKHNLAFQPKPEEGT